MKHLPSSIDSKVVMGARKVVSLIVTGKFAAKSVLQYLASPIVGDIMK